LTDSRETFCATGVFRESAENRTLGACAPQLQSALDPSLPVAIPARRRSTFVTLLINVGRVSEVTLILERAQHGEARAAEELLPLVYEELRKLASHKMANEAAGHTLQPTALVHEAWLRLVGNEAQVQFQNRAHFFGAAAEAMRRILIDRARRKRALRHGGNQQRVDIQETDLASSDNDDQLLAVNDALDKLAMQHKVEAELVKLRYFVGMTNNEAAEVLGISPRTAKYYWTHARAWLFREINSPDLEGKSHTGIS
jgi:RNA polymerase sigma factor (TIGR02999 family)